MQMEKTKASAAKAAQKQANEENNKIIAGKKKKKLKQQQETLELAKNIVGSSIGLQDLFAATPAITQQNV